MEAAERVVVVRSEGVDAREAQPLVEADRSALVNSGFQAQASHAVGAGIDRQMLDHPLRQSQATV